MILKNVRNLSIIIPFLLTVGYAAEGAKGESTTTTGTPVQISSESEWTKAWDSYSSLLQKNRKEALAILMAYCDSYPNDTNAIFETAAILYDNGAILDAIKYFSFLEGKPLSDQTKFDVFKLQGMIYHGQENYEKALEIFDSQLIRGNLSEVIMKNKKAENSAVVINFFGSTSLTNINRLINIIFDEYSINGNTAFHINIKSGGGDLHNSLMATSLLKQLPITISTYSGYSGSAAVVLHCLGEKRYAGNETFFYIHNATFDLPNKSTRNVKETIKEIEKMDNDKINIYKNCMTISEDEINKYIHGGDEWYLPAEEAKERGLVNQTQAPKIFPIKTFTIMDNVKKGR